MGRYFYKPVHVDILCWVDGPVALCKKAANNDSTENVELLAACLVKEFVEDSPTSLLF
ncbi:unnamed protein product [Meloidogyne enterolobii]|uniref:Uncharacterized protein n=1 Tax=Meloidogyne enterolobii TaxID=390850 RepID=A0ACB0ZQR2_MELEN